MMHSPKAKFGNKASPRLNKSQTLEE